MSLRLALSNVRSSDDCEVSNLNGVKYYQSWPNALLSNNNDK